MFLNKHLITVEDLFCIELLSEAVLAPDERQVVYCIQRMGQKTEKKYSRRRQYSRIFVSKKLGICTVA